MLKNNKGHHFDVECNISFGFFLGNFAFIAKLSFSPSLHLSRTSKEASKSNLRKKVFQLLRRVIMFWHIPPKNVYTHEVLWLSKKNIHSITQNENNIYVLTSTKIIFLKIQAAFSYFSSSFVLQNNPSQDVLGKRLLRTWKSFLYRL